MSQGAALQIQGSRESGQDVRGQNVTAVAAIANIVKSSLGPVGLDKVGRCKACQHLNAESAAYTVKKHVSCLADARGRYR